MSYATAALFSTDPAAAESITVPDPPPSLGKAGRGAWRRLWSAGRVWLSVDTDWDIMVRLCRSHDQCEAMREQIEADGLTGCWGSTGQLVTHPLLAALRQLETMMTKLESECGFSPVSRSRLGFAEVGRVSKVDELMARRQRWIDQHHRTREHGLDYGIDL